VQSNASDFIVVASVDMTSVCATPKPSSVAIADQLELQSYHPLAVVTNNGCNSISVVDIAPQLPTFDNTGHLTGFADNPDFGTIKNPSARPALFRSVRVRKASPSGRALVLRSWQIMAVAVLPLLTWLPASSRFPTL